MRIAHVNKLFPPAVGGVERAVGLIARRTAVRDDVQHVTVLTTNEAWRTEVTEELNSKLTVVRVPGSGRIFSVPIGVGFGRWFKALSTDLWHFHHPSPIPEIAALWTRPRGPWVVSYYSSVVRQRVFLPLYRPVTHELLRSASLIILNSPQMLHSEALHPWQAKCEVVPLGIDPALFANTPPVAEGARRWHARYPGPLVLFVGRFVYYKGLTYLIQAMKSVSATLLLAGDGPLRTEMQSLARETGVDHKVIFLGHVVDGELPSLYAACDVFVLPSTEVTEAFGVVQLEAMASGKPVVCTRLPTGVSYVNEHERTGLVVSPRSPGAIAEAVRQLLNDERLRARLGAEGRRRVETQFSIDVITTALVKLYRKLV